MRSLLLAVSLVSLSWFSAGCGDDPEPDCGESCAGEGGSGGDPQDGGAGDDGEAGTTGDGGTGVTEPDTSWIDHRPDKCTDEEAGRVFSTNLFQDVFNVRVSPRLEVGFSEKATVIALENGTTQIRLRTDGGKTIDIIWPGTLMEFPVDTKVTLAQTRDWTILTKENGEFAAMFQRNGAIPDEELSPLPGGKLDLRFAMQCNMSDDNSCTMDVVALKAGDRIFESGTIIHVDDWVVSNRSVMQTPGCQGYVPFRSLIWVTGRN